MIVTLQTQALQTLEQVRALWRATQRFPFQRKSALASWRSQSAGRTWAHLFDQGTQVVFGGGYRGGFHRALSSLFVGVGQPCGRGALAPICAPSQPPRHRPEGGPPTTAHPCGMPKNRGFIRGQDMTTTTDSDIAKKYASVHSQVSVTLLHFPFENGDRGQYCSFKKNSVRPELVEGLPFDKLRANGAGANLTALGPRGIFIFTPTTNPPCPPFQGGKSTP